MKKVKSLDKEKQLALLSKVTYNTQAKDDITFFEKSNMEGSLLVLAEIDHEREYNLIRGVASALLNKVPEPEEIDLDSE